MQATGIVLPSDYARSSQQHVAHVSALMLLLVIAFITISCGTIAPPPGNGGQALGLSGSLPGGALQQPYNAVLSVGGGSSPYQFSVASGTLPPGITLNPATGSITGQPTTAGTYNFGIVVTDSPLLDKGSQTYGVTINPTGGGIKVAISPLNTTLSSGGTQQFTATVTGTAHTAVTWSASTGSVNANGLYTAPSVQSVTQATVTATSQADSTQSAGAAVTINPGQGQSLAITTSSLPQAQQGQPYSASFSATGGTQPYSWSVTGGSLPHGITLGTSGSLSGTPAAVGKSSFSVTVTDAKGKTASGQFSITVVASNGYDGPAQLPLVTVSSAMADSPAPGAVVNVNSGGDLQSALNNAQCGETIQLQAGATFSGMFTVPAKNCDAHHWIIIRTSSPDSALPAEGQRITPCYAGVGSLPGRPAYSCSNPTNVLSKVQMTKTANGPFQFAAGANFYRFVGLEITRANGIQGSAALITNQGTADHIIVDRSWLHGNAQDETYIGYALKGGTYVAVVDSYFNDFHCISATGTCTDSHALSGGMGNNQDGPYKIQDNFLEASGEAILFGGGAATTTPADIEIVGNHFWKPWQWMKGNSPFVGGPDGHPFIVKNHLEIKNAMRVLAEANLMENSWGGFSQTGYGIVLTPKNQHTPGGGDVCPICQVADVTVRYTRISHGGAGIMMATSISGSGGDGGPAKAGTRWSVHDVVIDDIRHSYLGDGNLMLLSNSWPQNPLNTVTINHITGFPDAQGGGMLVMGNQMSNPAMYGLVFTNSIVVTGRYPVWNTGGGQTSCAVKDVPLTSMNNCFTTYTFANNALIASPPHYPPSSWPNGNLFEPDPNQAGFVNYNNGNGGNYQLVSTSPYKNAGTDGKDLGCDIAGLNAALAGVE